MEELNKSGRQPFGTRVMVKMKTVGTKNESGDYLESGFIIPKEIWEKRQMAEVVGQIVEKGANAWYDITDPPEVGDYVIIQRYAGIHIEGLDGESYRSVMDVNIHTKTPNGDDVKVISA